MPDDDQIRARSITLVDTEGRPRIVLDAGGVDGFAHITLISSTENRLDISAQPEGAVVLSFDRRPMVGALTISERGIVLRDADGKLGISVGDIFEDGKQHIIVYRNGEPVWQTPLSNESA